MTSGWALEVSRDDLSATTLLDVPVPEPVDGQAVLRADRVGVTANNVTYAVAEARPGGPQVAVQMRKRTADWGCEGLDDRFGQAWRSFVPAVEGWVDVTVGHGPGALQDVWLEVLSGRSAPRTGHVLQL